MAGLVASPRWQVRACSPAATLFGAARSCAETRRARTGLSIGPTCGLLLPLPISGPKLEGSVIWMRPQKPWQATSTALLAPAEQQSMAPWTRIRQCGAAALTVAPVCRPLQFTDNTRRTANGLPALDRGLLTSSHACTCCQAAPCVNELVRWARRPPGRRLCDRLRCNSRHLLASRSNCLLFARSAAIRC